MTARLLLVVLLAGIALPAAAQRTRPYRSGFWIENGWGTGTVRFGCATCEEAIAAYGESSYLRAGGSLSDRVLWGIEVFALLDDAFGTTPGDSTIGIENVSVGPVVLWYPWQSGLFVKGGVGLAHGEVLILEGEDVLPSIARGTGSGVSFGVGFDTPVFRWLSITTYFGVLYTSLGDFSLGGPVLDDAVTTTYNANFAFTIR